MNQNNISLLIAALMLSVQFTYAQGQNNLSRDHNEQVTVVGSFDPVINPSYKINLKPESNTIHFDAPDFSYPFLEKKISTSIELEPIKPAAIRTGTKSELYNNFFKLGFGSQISPYLEFFHSHGKKNDYRINAHVFHLSSFNNIANYSPSPYSSSKAAVAYQKYSDNHVFDAGLSYGLNTNRYYGFNPDQYPTAPSDNMLKQMFNLIRLKMGFESNYTKGNKLHHNIDVDAYYLFDKYQTSEANTRLSFGLYKAFKSSKRLDYQHLGLSGELAYYSNSDSLGSSSDLFIKGLPYFKAKYGMFSFDIGIQFNYLGTGSNSRFYVYPNVEVAAALFPESLTVYAGVKGGLKKNSFLTLSQENPWVTSTIISLQKQGQMWKNERLHLYVGAGGNIAQQVEYNLEVAFISFEDDYFFINEGDLVSGPLNKFSAAYDDGSVFSAGAEIAYTLDTRFKIWLGGKYDTYTLDSLPEAYHKPLSQVKLGASATIAKKVSIWTELYAYGQRFAVEKKPLQAEKEINLDSFMDLNLGVNYAINNKLSVFITGSNLLNSSYQRFYNYPVQGLQVMAGITFKF